MHCAHLIPIRLEHSVDPENTYELQNFLEILINPNCPGVLEIYCSPFRSETFLELLNIYEGTFFKNNKVYHVSYDVSDNVCPDLK